MQQGPLAPEPSAGNLRAAGRWLRRVLALAAAAVLVGLELRLSLWQWHRGEHRHALLNYSYGVEWAGFAVLTVVGLVALAREEARRGGAQPAPLAVPPSRSVLVGPPLAPGEQVAEVTYVRLLRLLRLR